MSFTCNNENAIGIMRKAHGGTSDRNAPTFLCIAPFKGSELKKSLKTAIIIIISGIRIYCLAKWNISSIMSIKWI